MMPPPESPGAGLPPASSLPARGGKARVYTPPHESVFSPHGSRRHTTLWRYQCNAAPALVAASYVSPTFPAAGTASAGTAAHNSPALTLAMTRLQRALLAPARSA